MDRGGDMYVIGAAVACSVCKRTTQPTETEKMEGRGEAGFLYLRVPTFTAKDSPSDKQVGR